MMPHPVTRSRRENGVRPRSYEAEKEAPARRRYCGAGCYDDSMIGVVPVAEKALESLCRRYAVRRLSVFGSALRGELTPESDLDVLVEFKPGSAIGLSFITLQSELSALFRRKVDLLTAGFLSPHFRTRVLEEALPLYEAA